MGYPDGFVRQEVTSFALNKRTMCPNGKTCMYGRSRVFTTLSSTQPLKVDSSI